MLFYIFIPQFTRGTRFVFLSAANARFLEQLNGASLSWYQCLFLCFELSLSNYLAGVTSLEPKKAYEAEKLLPVE